MLVTRSEILHPDKGQMQKPEADENQNPLQVGTLPLLKMMYPLTTNFLTNL